MGPSAGNIETGWTWAVKQFEQDIQGLRQENARLREEINEAQRMLVMAVLACGGYVRIPQTTLRARFTQARLSREDDPVTGAVILRAALDGGKE